MPHTHSPIRHSWLTTPNPRIPVSRYKRGPWTPPPLGMFLDSHATGAHLPPRSSDGDDNHLLAVGVEPGRRLLASSLDEDGAVRMFKNLAGDTPVEQSGQPCLTPRSDDDEIG